MQTENIKIGMIFESKSPLMKYPFLLIDEGPYADEKTISGRGSQNGEEWFDIEPMGKYVISTFYEFLQYEETKKPSPDTSRLADVE